MRKGDNPTKIGKLVEKTPCEHRVIIPLHVPNEEGYYKDAYKIFELCLFSVKKTASSPIKISVISNGSSIAVNERLIQLYVRNTIDELIIEREGVGKVNSILKALRTADERFVTITDADVLFKNNWESEVLKIFEAFPRAGAVSPVPVFRKHFELTHNIWFDFFFSSKLKFEKVTNVEGLEKFATSLGWKFLRDSWKDVILKLESRNGTKAVVGCPHFCATYKREVFDNLPKSNSIYKILGDSEYLYTDLPVLKNDGYRLATDNNYAFHLGNVFESWMQVAFDEITTQPKEIKNYLAIKNLKRNYLSYWIKNELFVRILKFRFVKLYLFKSKGLTSAQITNFTS